jgi:transposase
MQVIANRPEAPSAIRSELGAIFVSMEVSRSSWMITSLSPGSEKMSKHSVAAGDICALRTRFSNLEQKAFARAGKLFPIVVIQEAGLDGFWIHRVLQKEGIESHVVDPASIATSRRRRRAKTDRIDGEALLRTLLAHKRGEPRVCAMVKAPDQPHIRSSREATAPKSCLRQRGSGGRNHSEWRRFRPWKRAVRPPGSAKTSRPGRFQSFGQHLSSSGFHHGSLDDDTSGHIFP